MRYLYIQEKFIPKDNEEEVTANHFFYLDSVAFFKKLSNEDTKQDPARTVLVACYGPSQMMGSSDARWLYSEILSVITNCKQTYNFLMSEPRVPNVEFKEEK